MYGVKKKSMTYNRQMLFLGCLDVKKCAPSDDVSPNLDAKFLGQPHILALNAHITRVADANF